jgi:hypothetical protein
VRITALRDFDADGRPDFLFAIGGSNSTHGAQGSKNPRSCALLADPDRRAPDGNEGLAMGMDDATATPAGSGCESEDRPPLQRHTRIDWRTGRPMLEHGAAFLKEHAARRLEQRLSVAAYCEANGVAKSTFRNCPRTPVLDGLDQMSSTCLRRRSLRRAPNCNSSRPPPSICAVFSGNLIEFESTSSMNQLAMQLDSSSLKPDQ